MKIEITPATTEDASELNILVNSAYRGDASKSGWTTEADLLDGTRTDAALIKGIISTPGIILLKYVQEEKILGCMELRKVKERLYLGMLSVQPDLQGKGIGKELLKAAEAEAKRQNCNSIFMTVLTDRSELIDWYVRHGYSDTGKREPFHFDDPRFGQPKKKLEFAVLEKKM